MHTQKYLDALEGSDYHAIKGPGGLAEQWKGDPQASVCLASLCTDSLVKAETRFLACEALRAMGESLPDGEGQGLVAEAYVAALRSCTEAGGYRLGFAGNAWGYLWYDGDPGLGEVLIALGPASIPALVRACQLKEVVGYEGSEEATIGDMLHHRVCDFAAYYLQRITGLESRAVTLADRDFAARDRSIAALLAAVAAAYPEK